MLRWTKLGSKDAGSSNGSPSLGPGGSSSNGGGPTSPGGALDTADGAASELDGKQAEVDRFYGMENFGNTCYCNSVLQALYFCKAFRDCVTTYPTLLTPYVSPHPPPQPVFVPAPAAPARPGMGDKTPSSATVTSTQSGGQEKKASRWPGAKKVVASAVSPSPLSSPEPTKAGGGAGGVGAEDAANGTLRLVDPKSPTPPATLFLALQTLFRHIASIPPQPQVPAQIRDEKGQWVPNPQAGVTTVVAPAAFVGKLKMENEMFRGAMQQDAHEFLNYLLNKVGEDLEQEEKERAAADRLADKKRLEGTVSDLSQSFASLSTGPSASSSAPPRRKAPEQTFVHKLFQGTLVNETRCLTCETTSSRDEAFLDLSIDIEQNSSVTACLRQFSASETLCQRNKFHCDTCCGLQEAEKRLKIKTLPNVLALHLKRFKYQEDLGRYVKLNYRVVFPFQLRLPNTSDETENPDRLYELFAVVVHVGGGPHSGHYVAIVRTGGTSWTMFDDDSVTPVEEGDMHRYFGESASGSGYVLFYQAVDLDRAELGLRPRQDAGQKAGAGVGVGHDARELSFERDEERMAPSVRTSTTASSMDNLPPPAIPFNSSLPAPLPLRKPTLPPPIVTNGASPPSPSVAPPQSAGPAFDRMGSPSPIFPQGLHPPPSAASAPSSPIAPSSPSPSFTPPSTRTPLGQSMAPPPLPPPAPSSSFVRPQTADSSSSGSSTPAFSVPKRKSFLAPSFPSSSPSSSLPVSASLPGSTSDLASPKSKKEDSSGGNWFTRRTSSRGKDDTAAVAARRLSSSQPSGSNTTSWYVASPAESDSESTSSPALASSVASLPPKANGSAFSARERQSTAPASMDRAAPLPPSSSSARKRDPSPLRPPSAQQPVPAPPPPSPPLAASRRYSLRSSHPPPASQLPTPPTPAPPPPVVQQRKVERKTSLGGRIGLGMLGRSASVMRLGGGGKEGK